MKKNLFKSPRYGQSIYVDSNKWSISSSGWPGMVWAGLEVCFSYQSLNNHFQPPDYIISHSIVKKYSLHKVGPRSVTFLLKKQVLYE